MASSENIHLIQMRIEMTPDRIDTGDVKHHLTATDGQRHRLRRVEIAQTMVKIETCKKCSGAGLTPKDGHLVALRAERTNKMASDKSGRAGHEHLHDDLSIELERDFR